MKKKATYRIRNWSEYNASLKQRGSLTIWVSSEAVANWTTDELTGQSGASPTYTDLAIETMATAQAIYGLAGRQTQGFLQSLFELMKLELPVPDHSTLSRRRRQLTITLPVKDWSKPRHLVVDSTGVKVYGEGEWKVRQHGVGKRRTWRKLHLCNDEATLEIVSVVASTNDVTDAEALPDLLQDVLGEIELLIDEQLSAYQIGERLYESGIRTRHGKERWGSGTLVNLMRNPVYTGLYHYNKRQHVPAKRRNMPGAGPTRKRNSSRVIRPKEEWIPIEVP